MFLLILPPQPLPSLQVLLRWATQRGITVIPKSNNRDWMAANLKCNDLRLREEDLKAISALNFDVRSAPFPFSFWDAMADLAE